MILLASCDSDPAPYAGGEAWRCRAYLPVQTTNVLLVLAEATRAGWTYEAGPDSQLALTCPACLRARTALAGAST